MRIIVSAPYKAHTEPIFQRLKILNMRKIYYYAISMFMFKFENGILPITFNEMFRRNIDVHNYPTRQRNILNVPKVRLTMYQKTIKYMGVRLWNYIIDNVRCDCSIFIYKRNLKTFLLNNDLPDIANL